MYLFGLKMGWIEKVVAVIVLTTLIASAFPASFFVANAAGEGPAEVVAPIVIIDVCENLPEVQTEVPGGYSNDGDYCYLTPEPVEPTTYTIEGHKYECIYDEEVNEGEGDWNCDTPVAGWTISAQNGDSAPITTETDEMGFYSFTVTDGEWEVYENYSPYWQHIYTWEDGESISNEACSFEFGEIYAPSVVAKTSVASADAYCDFGNVHITYPITGMKWNDANSNGVQDEGEAGVANWRITAETTDSEDDRVVEAVTNEDGSYTLNLEEGTWSVSEESRRNWTQVAVEQDGEIIEGTTCEFNLRYNEKSRESVVLSKAEEDDCVFYNHEEPRRSGGSSGTRVKDRTPAPQVLGAATSTPSCDIYLHDYMRMNKAASSTEVTKLQIFLNAVGIKVEVTGMFDAATDAAVKTFQAQHKADVLTPWFKAGIVPHENPTGWVYQLTRWKINNIVCPGSEAYPSLDKS